MEEEQGEEKPVKFGIAIEHKDPDGNIIDEFLPSNFLGPLGEDGKPTLIPLVFDNQVFAKKVRNLRRTQAAYELNNLKDGEVVVIKPLPTDTGDIKFYKKS